MKDARATSTPSTLTPPRLAPLLPDVAAGVAGAVERCLDRYGGLVASMARKVLNDRVEADEAVHDIFVEIWKNAARFDLSSGSELAFITTLARRRLIDRLRRQRSRLKIAGEPLDVEPAVESTVAASVESNDELLRAREAMRQLSDDQRVALELSLGQGLSFPQIAEKLRMPLGTVKTNARRGLIRLREIMGVTVSAQGSAGGWQ